MIQTILIVITWLFACASLGIIFARTERAAHTYWALRSAKVDAEISLLKAQAAHVDQTRQVEHSNLEATIKAYEKQGANKLRTEIARLGGDRDAIEKVIGSKLKLYTQAEIDEKLEESRKIIGDLNDQIENLSPKVDITTPPPVYDGQPSSGASIKP